MLVACLGLVASCNSVFQLLPACLCSVTLYGSFDSGAVLGLGVWWASGVATIPDGGGHLPTGRVARQLH